MTDLTIREPDDLSVDSIQVDDRGEHHVQLKGKIDHCAMARQVARSALLTWGIGWFALTPDMRRAELALATVELLSGYCQPHGKAWEKFGKQPWTARDCLEVLRICKDWSMDGTCGRHLADMAAEEPDWPDDPIPELKRQMRRRGG